MSFVTIFFKKETSKADSSADKNAVIIDETGYELRPSCTKEMKNRFF
jgi:hypothetical protein